MQELLYRDDHSDAPEDHPQQGRVSFVFEAPHDATLRFTRTIKASGEEAKRTAKSLFDIDGRELSKADFAEQLLQLGINTKARNFLVFQVR